MNYYHNSFYLIPLYSNSQKESLIVAMSPILTIEPDGAMAIAVFSISAMLLYSPVALITAPWLYRVDFSRRN